MSPLTLLSIKVTNTEHRFDAPFLGCIGQVNEKVRTLMYKSGVEVLCSKVSLHL